MKKLTIREKYAIIYKNMKRTFLAIPGVISAFHRVPSLSTIVSKQAYILKSSLTHVKN